jgi:hypothetical protein
MDKGLICLSLNSLCLPHLLRQLLKPREEVLSDFLLKWWTVVNGIFCFSCVFYGRLFLLLVGSLDFGEVCLVLSFKAFQHPRQLLLRNAAIDAGVDDFHEFLHLPQPHFEAIVLQELEEVFRAEPMMVMTVNGYQRPLARVFLSTDQLPPQLDDAHFSVHDF